MNNPRESASQFLATQGWSLDDVIGCVPDSAPWETVVFGGSIPEGLANADSDVDLLMVGDPIRASAEGTMPPYQVGTTTIAFKQNLGSLRVQVETVRLAHLESVAKQMQTIVADFDHPESRSGQWLADIDVRTIHRLNTGICLSNPLVVAGWQRRLQAEFLPTYLLATNTAHHYNLLEDAVGEAREARWPSALWALRYAVGFAAGALLASIDETNPNAKWWVRLLQRHRTAAGESLSDQMIELMTGRVTLDPEAHLEHAREVCGTVMSTAIARNSRVSARRKKVGARAASAGVSLPGLRKRPPQSDGHVAPPAAADRTSS